MAFENSRNKSPVLGFQYDSECLDVSNVFLLRNWISLTPMKNQENIKALLNAKGSGCSFSKRPVKNLTGLPSPNSHNEEKICL